MQLHIGFCPITCCDACLSLRSPPPLQTKARKHKVGNFFRLHHVPTYLFDNKLVWIISSKTTIRKFLLSKSGKLLVLCLPTYIHTYILHRWSVSMNLIDTYHYLFVWKNVVRNRSGVTICNCTKTNSVDDETDFHWILFLSALFAFVTAGFFVIRYKVAPTNCIYSSW